MGPQGSGSSHPIPWCFSTRAGGSFSQLFVSCVSSLLSQAAMQDVRRSSSVSSSVARTVQPGLFSIYARTLRPTLRTNTRICRSMTGRFSGTKVCRTPGSCRRDPNNSVRRDRSLHTPSVGALRQVQTWLLHCIPSCRSCFPKVLR